MTPITAIALETLWSLCLGCCRSWLDPTSSEKEELDRFPCLQSIAYYSLHPSQSRRLRRLHIPPPDSTRQKSLPTTVGGLRAHSAHDTTPVPVAGPHRCHSEPRCIHRHRSLRLSTSAREAEARESPVFFSGCQRPQLFFGIILGPNKGKVHGISIWSFVLD